MVDSLPHTLRTPRLALRPLAVEDGPRVVEYMSDLETARMLARVPAPYTIREFDQFLSYTQTGEEQVWAIAMGEGAAPLVGCIGLAPVEGRAARVGFWLGKPHRRQGVMREALRAVLEAAFALGIQRVYAGHFDDNAASRDLQHSVGFVPGARGQTLCLAMGQERPHTDTYLDAVAFKNLYPDG